MWMQDDVLELTDADWTERVTLRLLSTDDGLTGPEAYALAVRLCERPRWRHLDPDAAALKAVDEPEAVEGV